MAATKKPVYAHPGATAQTTGPAEFAQWYNDVPGVNTSLSYTITLIETRPGFFEFPGENFFPIDGRGFGNEGRPHNYQFTTELHTQFVYKAGQRFTFIGDDDLFLFVNGRLALDLGGLHEPVEGVLELGAMAQTLGITPGNTYRMDIFHAERHTVLSNFHIETTIDCFIVK